MRFMVMHKVDAEMEAGGPPCQEIIDRMGALCGESAKAGVFLDGAGLHRSAQRVRLRFRGGECAVTKGPYAGENELVSGFAMIRAKSMNDAIQHARRFAAVVGDVEIEIGPVVEPWDLGLVDKPADLESGRFLFLVKGNQEFEADVPPRPQVLAAMAELTAKMTREGVLLKAGGLAPSSKGARLPAGPKGKRNWVDGPFAESKELIAGFSILNVESKRDAIAWADRYADVLAGNEVDVRVVREASDFPSV